MPLNLVNNWFVLSESVLYSLTILNFLYTKLISLSLLFYTAVVSGTMTWLKRPMIEAIAAAAAAAAVMMKTVQSCSLV